MSSHLLLPTTSVGSFPKPKYVKSPKGFLDENSRKATAEFIKRQEEIGIDVLVDGEFYVEDMETDYGRAFGLPIAGWTEAYFNRFWKKIIVDRKLECKRPIRLEQFVYAQGLTQKPVKGMLTGPGTLASWGFYTPASPYKSLEEVLFAFASIINQEALRLQDAGAKYIQIDEPAIAEWPDDLNSFAEGLRIATNGVKAKKIMHFCYGDFPKIYDKLLTLPVDQLDIEISNELDAGIKNSRLLSMMKENPLTKYKEVAVGVIDVRPGIPVERVDVIKERIYTALDVLAPTDLLLKRIWIKPDCGFRTTKDIDVSYAKLEAMMDAVRQVRNEL